MLVATYDYWGYYNVAFLGDEVKEPEKNIPSALLLSILLVGCLYVVMNVSILGVMPWQEMLQSGQTIPASMSCRCSCSGFTAHGRQVW